MLGLVMIVKDEAPRLERCLASVKPLLHSWTICDTGSSDGTVAKAEQLLGDLPGAVYPIEWRDFAAARTEALALAPESDWLLMLDADMTVEAHPELLRWLEQDPDPDVDAWLVEILERGTRYRLPLLVRGGPAWRYRSPTHEWLDLEGRKARPLLGLTVEHHADGASRPGKHERDLELLRSGFEAGEPRAIFYTAQAHRFLGETEQAIAAYRARAAISEGWEEEAWYASYQAAKLAGDVEGLLVVHEARPHRHEPLSAAAELVAAAGAGGDMLFLEPLAPRL